MVEHQSKEVVDKMSDELKIQPALLLPKKIVDSIQPVYNVNPIRVVNVIDRGSSASSGGTTIFTAPSDRDFFLTGAHLNITKDVTSDNILDTLTVIQQGATQVLLEIRTQTVTAETIIQNKQFTFPIKIDRGSIIVMNGSFTAGALTKGAVITGYTTDPQ